MKRKLSKISWGISFLCLGVIFALRSFMVLDVSIFFKGWWTLFIILPSLIGIFVGKVKSVNVFGFVLGLSILLYSLDVIQFQNIFDIVLCFFFILFGVKFVFGKGEKSLEIADNGEKFPSYFNAFGKSFDKLKGEKHCKVTSVVGHQVVDLTDLKCKECFIDVHTVFSSVEFIVCKDDKVVSEIFQFIGSFKNKLGKVKKARRVIYLHGFTIFGGVSIKTK